MGAPLLRLRRRLDFGSVAIDNGDAVRKTAGLRKGKRVTQGDAGKITALLRRVREGEGDASDRLYTILYDELRDRAHRCLGYRHQQHTLCTTALVNEAWFRLVRASGTRWEDRGHFLAVAARAMRSVIIDHARARGRQKRGGGAERVPLDGLVVAYEERGLDLMALDDALDRLSIRDAESSRLVELRFFGGLTLAESAETLGIALRTAERRWRHARAWLRRELS